MAKTADKETVRRDSEGPKYGKAIDLIRGAIAKNQSDSSAIGQKNSQHFQRIDKEFGVHPGAAKDFGKIDRMPGEKRDDYLRSLFGLLKVAKFGEFNDLVDQMEGSPTTGGDTGQNASGRVVPFTGAKTDHKPSGTPAGAAPPADDSDLAGDDEPMRSPITSALEAARKHMGTDGGETVQ